MSDLSPEDREVRRREIVGKYARLRNDRPVFCEPSRSELKGRRKQGAGTDGKVIYPDQAAARAAADELEALYGDPLLEFACKRSKTGHFHLATDRKALRARTAE